MRRRDWDREQAGRALRWLASTLDMAVWRDVVVSEGSWRGWPVDTAKHVLDGVAVKGGGRLLTWDEEQFALAVTQSVVRPVAPWGVANRPVLGLLVTYSAMLARTYPGHGPIQPLALVSHRQDRPNTASAYHAYGIEIVAVPDGVV